MFYSQLLLSKTGALGIVWMAAHCHKRLKKHQIQQTNISSSVDKILDDEVCVVTHRILAFLLLGIVRIYSKKVEFLFNDCHDVLNRLYSFGTRKKKQAGVGVSRTHYHSISLPKRFELDTFNLDLLENQLVRCGNVRSHEQDVLADGRQKDGGTSSLQYEETIPITEAQSKVHTPPRDVFGPHHMDQNAFAGPSSKMKISLAGVDVLRGTRLSLEGRLDPTLDGDQDQMHKRQLSDEDLRNNYRGLINEMDSDSDEGRSSKKSHLLPNLEIVPVTVFALDDYLEPMVLDEAEQEHLNGGGIYNHNKSSKLQGPIQDVGFDFVSNRSPEGSGCVASFGVLNESGISLKMSNEAENEQGHDKPSDKEEILNQENVDDRSTQLDFQKGENRDCTVPVDKAKPVDVGIKVAKVINPKNMPEEIRVSVATLDSKFPAAGNGTPEVATIRTPGRKERAKNLKKRKTLFDTDTVVPNKVFKNWLDDPTDLKRKRREVPHTILDAWRAYKHAHIPHSFFAPSLSGISEALGYLEYKKSCAQAVEVVELSNGQDGAKSPVTYAAPEQIPAVRSTVGETSSIQTLDIRSPVREGSPGPPIAPGTPVAHPHEVVAVADSDIIEPTASYESIEKGPSSSDPLGFDVFFQEETSPYEGESLEKDTYSARTRVAASYLGRKFLEKKRREEEQVLNLSRLLARKTKKESARFFYEVLVLKTRDCIDVQQEIAYRDILLQETPKLRQVCDR